MIDQEEVAPAGSPETLNVTGFWLTGVKKAFSFGERVTFMGRGWPLVPLALDGTVIENGAWMPFEYCANSALVNAGALVEALAMP